MRRRDRHPIKHQSPVVGQFKERRQLLFFGLVERTRAGQLWLAQTPEYYREQPESRVPIRSKTSSARSLRISSRTRLQKPDQPKQPSEKPDPVGA